MEDNTQQQLQKIRQQFSVVNAKISFMQEGLSGLKDSFEQLTDEFDFFIDLYGKDMNSVKERLTKSEKHIGLWVGKSLFLFVLGKGK